LKIAIGYPDRAAERQIVTTQPSRAALDALQPVANAADIVELQNRVPLIRIDTSLVDYLLDLVESSRHHEQLHLGISPRGALALAQASQAAALLAGRNYVTPDDVKRLFIPVCAHRVVSKTYLHNGDADATSRVLQTILDQVPTPR
jgi:MoxR-like ATPase